MIRAILALAAAALLARSDDDPLKGYAPAGPAARCLPSNDLSPVILDRHTVAARDGGRRWWVSRVEDCPTMEPVSTIIMERFGTPVCDTDRFQVLRAGETIPGRFCRFAPFVPYDRVAERR